MNIVMLQDIKLIHRNPLQSYTLNNEKSEREIKETIPFTIAKKKKKRIKYFSPKETKSYMQETIKH